MARTINPVHTPWPAANPKSQKILFHAFSAVSGVTWVFNDEESAVTLSCARKLKVRVHVREVPNSIELLIIYRFKY